MRTIHLIALLLVLGASGARAEEGVGLLRPLLDELAVGRDSERVREKIERIWQQPQEPGIGILMERAIVARDAGDAAVAERLANDITAISPHYAQGWMLRGRLAYAHGDTKAARRAWERVVALEPNQYIAHRLLGDLARQEGDLSRAEGHYRRVLSIDPFAADITEDLEAVQIARAERGI